MRTPYGQECPYFYGDYYRGREREECRLLGSAVPPLPWQPSLCKTCPVPEIARANSCEYLMLRPALKRSFPFLQKHVEVSPYCEKSKRSGFDPHIGCGECHPLPLVFKEPE